MHVHKVFLVCQVIRFGRLLDFFFFLLHSQELIIYKQECAMASQRLALPHSQPL